MSDRLKMLPRTARLLDAGALACALLAVAIALAPSRVRLDIGWTNVSLGSPWRPLLLALLLVAVRHVRHPRPHVGERILAWWRTPEPPSAQLAVRMILFTRLPILVIGLAATLLIGLPARESREISQDPVKNLPARWDATWYMEIARVGYAYDPRRDAGDQQAIVFFPAYPILMRTLGAFTTPDRTPVMSYDEYLETRKVHLAWCGVVISLVAFAGAVVVLYRWAESHSDADTAVATVALLSAYPFAVFYSAPYTESLFLLLAAGACYAFERGRLMTAGTAALLAGLTRPNGVMLCVPLGLLALAEIPRREPGWVGRCTRGLAVALMPLVGLLLYCAFMYRLAGDPFAWIDAQAAWGRDRGLTAAHYGWIWRTIANEGVLAYVRAVPAEVFQIPAVLLALALVAPVWRRIGAAYALFMLANLVPPLIQGGLLSMGRFTSTLFPMFLALALLVPAGRRTGWYIAFALGQGLVAAVFFTWRPIY